MSIRLKPAAVFLPVLLSTQTLHAQESMAPVVVTTTRFESAQQPQAIAAQVITADEIRDSSASSVSEVLSKLGGVHTRINFTGTPDTPIDLRGFGMTGDQNTLVLVNGERLSENEGIPARLSAIPLDSIERIEILRGSGAVLYGGGATAGAINIITRSPIGGGRSGNVSVMGGSHNMGDLRAGLQSGEENWGLRLNAQHYENNNYRQNNRAQQDAFSGEWRVGQGRDFVALGFNVDTQKARLPGARTEAQLSSDPRGAQTPNDYTNSDNQMFSIRGEKNLEDIVLAMDVSQRHKTSEMYNATSWGTSLGKTSTDITAVSPRLLWKSQVAGAVNQLTVGMDWSNWTYGNNTLGTGYSSSMNEQGTQSNRAFYFRNEVGFVTGTRVSLGARRENITQTDQDPLVPRPQTSANPGLTASEVALQQELGRGISAYGRTGQSFRVANIDENRCTYAPCATSLLNPQRSRDKELGVQWRDKRSSLRASLFDIALDNEIHYNQLTYSNMNLSPTERKGLELEGKTLIQDTIDLALRYTRTQARFRTGVYGGVDVTGNDVPLVPKNRIGLNLGWQVQPKTRLGFNVVYVGEQTYDNDQANLFHKMPSYTLADIRVSHEMGPWRFAAGVNNLFDQQYYSYGIVNGSYTSFNAYPEDRRNAYLSAEYRF